MTSPRTLLGPLTTTWTPPGVCTYGMALCDTCTTVWQAQTCNSDYQARDATGCWPPRAASVTSDPGVMMGWGLYSPGVICPAGYTTAALATAGGSSGWGIEYSMFDGETAAACCPSGFTISSIDVSSTYAQTCVLTATSTSFSTVQCRGGTFTDFSLVQLPMSESGQVFSTYVVFAPLYQMNWQSSDLSLFPSTTQPPTTTTAVSSSSSSASTAGSSSASTGSNAGSSSASTTGSPGSSGGDTAGSSSGLSSGAKAGIGVGIAVGILVALALLFLVFRTVRRRKQAAEVDDKPLNDSEHGGGAAAAAGLPPPKAIEADGREVEELDGTPRQSGVMELATSSAKGERAASAAHDRPVFELEADSPITARNRRMGHPGMDD